MKTSLLCILGILGFSFLWIPVTLSLPLDPMAACGWYGLTVFGLIIVFTKSRSFKTRALRISPRLQHLHSSHILGLILLAGGLASGSVGLKQLLDKPQYNAGARMRIYFTTTDLNLLANGYESDANLSWTYICVLPEYIKSPSLLSNVVETLDLKTRWAQKYGNGKKLGQAEAVAIIKQQLIVSQVRGTLLLAVSVTSDDPDEAAMLANAIAGACAAHAGDLQAQVISKVRQTGAGQPHLTPQEIRAACEAPAMLVKTVDSAEPSLAASGPDRVQSVWSLAGGLLALVVGSVILRRPRANLRVAALMKIPWLSMLGIIALAGGLAMGSVSLGQLLDKAQYGAVTRILSHVERNGVSGQSGPHWSDDEFAQVYDKSIEAFLKSPSILSNLVVTLDLNTKWDQKYGNGRKLATVEAERILRQELVVRPVRGTRLTAILAISDDPDEAVLLANAITRIFVIHADDLKAQLIAEAKQEWDRQSKKIKSPANEPPGGDDKIFTLVSHAIQDPHETRETWDPLSVFVKITDPAGSPPFTIGPERVQSAWSLVGGLLAVVVGSAILRRTKVNFQGAPS